MALEIKLSQKLSQTLLMTPQLQQAIKLLQLGRLEYKEAVEKELLENPVLEEIKSDDPVRGQENARIPSGEEFPATQTDESEPEPRLKVAKPDSPLSWEDYLSNYSDYREAFSSKGFVDYEDRPSLEATLSREQSLTEHLSSQIRLSDCRAKDFPVIMYVIGNLDKDGYLRASDEEIAAACNCSLEQVANAVALVQGLDPVGVGARNLSECLIIQLDNLGYGDSLATRICRSHLDKLEKRKFDQIAKEEHVSLPEVYHALSIIQQLEPRPARQFVNDPTRYIVPDIYVYKDGGEYIISLNEDGLPKLRVNPYYLRLLQNNHEDSGMDRAYLTERLKAASWLIKSIHQRQQTIYKVTESIVKFQRDFLDKGIEALKPLVLKDVADDIGMHESTVSRVTTNKYVHTPQGVFELKFFFTTGIKTGQGEVSSAAVKERIRSLIEAEPAHEPISDQRIVEILKAENIDIARRTVAKYRESMQIPPSSQRKKPF